LGTPAELAPRFAASGDERPFHRAELRALNASITAALAKAADKETRAHLEGARDQIAKILDPKFVQPPAPARTTDLPRVSRRTIPFRRSRIRWRSAGRNTSSGRKSIHTNEIQHNNR
jgi:hypothetical protein